eukprot:CAMPEP_0182515256 /NCGR_PEP_ID=MMETSP1321-20130603/37691_1 /TAXON_ID=91990 /ORGANISM="Bolidomonas sp., Strain RCC1657" /LENGTH=191 /DNA_ID=CAMNT_0024722641 /DNA_START=69 /DNA_END=641 /DNA_ORIENTATION=+
MALTCALSSLPFKLSLCASGMKGTSASLSGFFPLLLFTNCDHLASCSLESNVVRLNSLLASSFFRSLSSALKSHSVSIFILAWRSFSLASSLSFRCLSSFCLTYPLVLKFDEKPDPRPEPKLPSPSPPKILALKPPPISAVFFSSASSPSPRCVLTLLLLRAGFVTFHFSEITSPFFSIAQARAWKDSAPG